MFEFAVDENVTVGNGGKAKAIKIGKKRVEVRNKDGTIERVILNNVKVVPELAPYSLFSITWALNHGFKLGNEGKTITLSKGNFLLKFDNEIQTHGGYLAGVEMTPCEFTTDEENANREAREME